MRANTLDAIAAEFDRKAQTVPNVDFDKYMRMREADKAKVKSVSEFRDAIVKQVATMEHHGSTLPWNHTIENFRFRRGEITTWVGFNGSLKSMLTGFVMLDQIRQGQKVCVASFEMKPQVTVERMIKQAVGSGNPTEAYIDKFFSWGKQSLWFYDQQGTVEAERIISVIYYCAEQLGVTHFLVDSLMKCIPDEDDMNGQKRFVDKLCAAAHDLDIHIHLVHHSRKKENERNRPGKQDAKGSGSIVDQTDNFFVVFKVPEKKDNEPDVMLYCDKQRNGKWTGQLPLWFEQNSLQFLDRQGALPIHIV